jgi:hypothetical protein
MIPDEGFVPMFNWERPSGWQGLVENPVARAKMKPAELAKKQLEANKKISQNWSKRTAVYGLMVEEITLLCQGIR